jgi:hypothetical protein
MLAPVPPVLKCDIAQFRAEKKGLLLFMGSLNLLASSMGILRLSAHLMYVSVSDALRLVRPLR